MAEKYIYAILFSTPFNTGKFIRLITGFPYNHGGIAFDFEMKKFYSFARRYKSTPFYGGFVMESLLRYKHGKNIATAAVYKIPVSEEQFESAKNRVSQMQRENEDYLYNFASAFFFPLEHWVEIEKAYTCMEFVLSMLKTYADVPELKAKEFYSIEEFYGLMEPYKCFEGSVKPFLRNADWEEDKFPQKYGFFKGIAKTLGVFWELGRRYFTKKHL